MYSIPDTIPADPFELRLVTAADATAVEASVTDRASTFHYFTRKPFPVTEFLAKDPQRRMYALWSGDQVVGSTSVYHLDEAEPMLGFTWVSESARGTGANRAMKSALFGALGAAGVPAVWFRADADNEISRRSLESNGAVFSHIDDAPREYPDGRVTRSVFYRREL